LAIIAEEVFENSDTLWAKPASLDNTSSPSNEEENPQDRQVTVDEIKKALACFRSPSASRRWQTLLRAVGGRGEAEFDIASPRFREKSDVLLAQIAIFASNMNLRRQILPRDATSRQQSRKTWDPASSADVPSFFEQSVFRRKNAVSKISQSLLVTDEQNRFLQHAAAVESLASVQWEQEGVIVSAIDTARARAIQLGQDLMAMDRIDETDDVFHLTLAEVDRALSDSTLDLRALVVSRRPSAPPPRSGDKKAKNDDGSSSVAPSVTFTYPVSITRHYLFDSRGRRLHAPFQPLKASQIRGWPASPGIATGNVFILQSTTLLSLNAFEDGDVIVTNTLDPAWAAFLILRASAVILENGGSLQRAISISHLFSKPCVIGANFATQLLQNGMKVEVDGSTGLITIQNDATGERWAKYVSVVNSLSEELRIVVFSSKQQDNINSHNQQQQQQQAAAEEEEEEEFDWEAYWKTFKGIGGGVEKKVSFRDRAFVCDVEEVIVRAKGVLSSTETMSKSCKELADARDELTKACDVAMELVRIKLGLQVEGESNDDDDDQGKKHEIMGSSNGRGVGEQQQQPVVPIVCMLSVGEDFIEYDEKEDEERENIKEAATNSRNSSPPNKNDVTEEDASVVKGIMAAKKALLEGAASAKAQLETSLSESAKKSAANARRKSIAEENEMNRKLEKEMVVLGG
jgi:phosphohistidine swiveling domain-containing protein